ncbi:MAG: diguanylate cyclase [Candidatus Omnitrophica bacterium]|nr:diguanylate cyclase [Candidatus Omnitrophota bacterium]
MLRSIRIKLLAILSLVSALVFVLAIFSITTLDRVARTADSIVSKRVPLSRCSHEAILAVASGVNIMEQALLVQDPDKMETIRHLEGQFRETMITFDMFTKAMIWGSESPAFKRSAGGLTLAQWERRGLKGRVVVEQAPSLLQELAIQADHHYAHFSESVKKVLRSQKRILRLTLQENGDQILRESAVLQENLERAKVQKALVEEQLRLLITAVYKYLMETGADIAQIHKARRSTLFGFSIGIILLCLALGRFFFFRFIARPISRLQKGIEIVSTGRLDYKVATEAKDEIGQLSRAFDKMVDQFAGVKQKLEDLAVIDPLTELLNRRGLQMAISKEIKRRGRQQDSLQAILVDIDDFKRINDQLGHSVGDILLRDVAKRIKAVLRESDYVARIGGDEFIILMPSTRIGEGLQTAERIRLSVSSMSVITRSEECIRITASLGMVTVDETKPSVDELLGEMHLVLKTSKEAGKNRLSSAAAASEPSIFVSGWSPEHIHAIVKGKAIQVARQPINSSLDRSVVGYEFLIRTTLEGFGMPGDFFPKCLESNILSQADHRCFSKCIEAAASLPTGMRYHFNLFPSTLADIPTEHLIGELKELQKNGACCVEISEQQILSDPSFLVGPVRELKAAGVAVALDDMGFGRSSLESLIILEPDIIKIDRSLIQGVASNPVMQGLLKRLLDAISALGLEVIAEGVETEEDFDYLKKAGIQYCQGFLFAKPHLVY